MDSQKLERLRQALEDLERKRDSEDFRGRTELLLLEEKARQIATRSLNAAPRTRSQLAQKLLERDLPEEVIESVLDRYEEVGLVNDAAFARGWIRSRAASKGVAALALREELRRKGIEASIIEAAISECLPAETEAESGLELSRVKAQAVVRRMGPEGISSPQEREKALRKIVAAVARKGHSPSSAYQWARQALDEQLESD